MAASKLTQEGTSGGNEPDERGYTPKPAKGFSGKHTLKNPVGYDDDTPLTGERGAKHLKKGDLVTDRKTGKKYDPFKAMNKLMKREERELRVDKAAAIIRTMMMDRDTMPKPKVHHGSGEVINDRSKQHKKILRQEGAINEISKRLAARYLDKTAPGSPDSLETSAEILRAGERAKQQGSKLGGYDRKKAAKTLANDPKYAKATQKWLNRRKGRAAADARLQGEEVEYQRLIDEGVVVEVYQDEVNEGKEFDFRAHMALSQGARRKPGHYLTKDGSTLSGPHPSPTHAVRAYKDLPDTSGVKIVHVKESTAEEVYANDSKAKKTVNKAISLARAKKSKKDGKGAVNGEPTLEMPKNQNNSAPILQGDEEQK